MIALDLLEQIHTDAFELIATNALQDALTSGVQIGFEDAPLILCMVRCALETVSNSTRDPAPAQSRSGARGFDPESSLSCACARTTGFRFREAFCAERECLVGAEHDLAGISFGHCNRFRAGKQKRCAVWFCGLDGCCRLGGAFIDIGGIDNERNARCLKQHPARCALGCEDQRLSAP